jgi:hypothetical protein
LAEETKNVNVITAPMVAKAKAMGTDELSALTAKPIPAPTEPEIAVFRHFGASAFIALFFIG